MLLAFVLSHKIWELFKYLSHFVSSLTASDVDNALGVRVFGKSLGNASFSATEGTWDSASTTQHRWVESIKDSLSSKQWFVGLELLNVWSWGSYWPEVTHAELFLFTSWGLDDANWLSNSILAFWENFDNFTGNLWIRHDLMVLEKSILIYITKNVTTGNEGAHLDILIWLVFPVFVLVEAR